MNPRVYQNYWKSIFFQGPVWFCCSMVWWPKICKQNIFFSKKSKVPAFLVNGLQEPFSPSEMLTFFIQNHHIHKIPYQIAISIHRIFYKAILKRWDPYQEIRKIIFWILFYLFPDIVLTFSKWPYRIVYEYL